MIYGNLPPEPKSNETTNYFETFFDPTMGTSPNVNDAFIGYFQSVTGNAETGVALAGSVLYSALNQGIEPMSLLDEFRKLPPKELNNYLTMLLNLNRIGTSLLGISNAPQTNRYVARAVLP